jgi:hypothetical protein
MIIIFLDYILYNQFNIKILFEFNFIVPIKSNLVLYDFIKEKRKLSQFTLGLDDSLGHLIIFS